MALSRTDEFSCALCIKRPVLRVDHYVIQAG